jgi:hypothetical protein
MFCARRAEGYPPCVEQCQDCREERYAIASRHTHLRQVQKRRDDRRPSRLLPRAADARRGPRRRAREHDALGASASILAASFPRARDRPRGGSARNSSSSRRRAGAISPISNSTAARLFIRAPIAAKPTRPRSSRDSIGSIGRIRRTTNRRASARLAVSGSENSSPDPLDDARTICKKHGLFFVEKSDEVYDKASGCSAPGARLDRLPRGSRKSFDQARQAAGSAEAARSRSLSHEGTR